MRCAKNQHGKDWPCEACGYHGEQCDGTPPTINGVWYISQKDGRILEEPETFTEEELIELEAKRRLQEQKAATENAAREQAIEKKMKELSK